MNILMTGGTGFIGSRLVEQLTLDKNHVYILTRNPKQHQDTAYISYISYQYPIKKLPFIHAMINLAGESLFGYWTDEKKDNILKSRSKATEKLTNVLMHMEKKPETFISGSAIGFYGPSDDQIFTESTTSPGDDFLAKVCTKWEKAASNAEDLGIRTVYTRFGVVLDKHEGALPLMALPFKFGLGGKVGHGEQWMSWIHIDDCVNMLILALYNKNITGPLNVTAPYPKQNKDFSKILASTLRRPSLIKAPSKLFELATGEMSSLITTGQFVYPEKAIEHGFSFEYPYLEHALKDIYR